MRPHSLLVAATVLLTLSVLSSGIATGRPAIGGSYWAENTLNKVITAWPQIAIAVLVGLLVAGMVGFYVLDWAPTVLLLAAIALLVYEFYWQRLSRGIPL